MITAALTSFGAAIVRPIVSASKNVNAPKNAENGISILWLLPTKILPICGTINPKNSKSINVFSHIGMINVDKLWYEISLDDLEKWLKR